MSSPKSPPESGAHTCGWAFSTLEAHRAHNARGKCIDPADLGYVLHTDGRYGPYGSPVLGERLPDDWKLDENSRPKAYLNVVKEQRGEPPPKKKREPKPEPKRVFPHLAREKKAEPKPKVKAKGKTQKPKASKIKICRKCGNEFTRPDGRGRPPVNCEPCRGIK